MRSHIISLTGSALGLLAGIALWGAVLGVQVTRYQPGLWSIRPQRILACGVDYNGPAWTKQGTIIWLTCDSEDQSWQLWPIVR